MNFHGVLQRGLPFTYLRVEPGGSLAAEDLLFYAPVRYLNVTGRAGHDDCFCAMD
jgi:hypothetical protein